MQKEHLKVMRLLVPGVLIFLVCYPLFKGSLTVDALLQISTKDALYIILVLVGGGMYKTFELRGILFKERLDEVHENIKVKLITPFQADPMYAKLVGLSPKAFLKVFYNIADNDESLKEKMKDVYENGLLWSSYSDLGVISFFGVLIYLAAFVATGNKDFIFMVFVLAVLFGISIPLIMISVRKHKALGDDQLEIITTIHRPRLEELLRNL